jgi:outer membrane protein assembly factor BamD (BamD/ComL family)
VPGCPAKASLLERKACFTTRAQGEGLGAENALYALGLLARDEEHRGDLALARWRSYELRFPAGAFAPEVSLGIVGVLTAQKRWAEALAQVDDFLQRYPGDPRAGRMGLVRAGLLRSSGATREALHAYRALSQAGTSSGVRADAMFDEGTCLEELGDHRAALDAWQRYLNQFPAGRHAAAVRALLRRH